MSGAFIKWNPRLSSDRTWSQGLSGNQDELGFRGINSSRDWPLLGQSNRAVGAVGYAGEVNSAFRWLRDRKEYKYFC